MITLGVSDKYALLSRKTKEGEAKPQLKEPIGAVKSISNHNKRDLNKIQELSNNNHKYQQLGKKKKSLL